MGGREAKDTLYAALARMGKALSNGKRLELLDLLGQGERTVEALARAAGMTVANTSAHLQVLRQGGVVASRKDGTRVWYRLADDDVARFVLAFRGLARGRLADVDRAARDYLGEVEEEPLAREELRRRLRHGEVVVLDVRPPEEYEAGHIPGAWSMPLDELERRLDEVPDDVEVVAYCRGPLCVLAPMAVRTLRRHGRRARTLEDGFPEWRLEGLPVRTGP